MVVLMPTVFEIFGQIILKKTWQSNAFKSMWPGAKNALDKVSLVLLKCQYIHAYKQSTYSRPQRVCWSMCVRLPSHLCAVTKVTRIKSRHNRSLFFSPLDLPPLTDKSCRNNKKCKTAELFMKSHMKVVRGNKSLRIALKRRMCVPISEGRGGGTVLLIWSADKERCVVSVYLCYQQRLEVWMRDVWESSSVER